MAKVLEHRTTKKSALSTEKAVSLWGGMSASGAVELKKESCCPLDDKEARKLLEYSCKRIAAICAQWRRNAK